MLKHSRKHLQNCQNSQIVDNRTVLPTAQRETSKHWNCDTIPTKLKILACQGNTPKTLVYNLFIIYAQINSKKFFSFQLPKIFISQFLRRTETKNFSFIFYFTKNTPSLLTTKKIKCKKKTPTARNSKASLNFISVDKLNLSILFFSVKSKFKKLFLQKTFLNDYLLFPLALNLKASIVLHFKL